MSKKLKLALDMDNTINKLSPTFLQYVEYNLWGNSNDPLSNRDVIVAEEWESFSNNFYKYYELGKYFPLIPENTFKKIYYLVFNDYDFWINIPPMDNISGNIEFLNNTFDLYIVTYPYQFLENSIKGKLYWIKKYLPFIRRHQIIFEDKKNSDHLNYDIIIDDNPDILEKARAQKNTFVVRFNHSYNLSSFCHCQLSEWTYSRLYKIKQYTEVYFKF